MRSQHVIYTLALAMQAVHCHLAPPPEGEAQGKIDVHGHFMPPEWRAEVEKTGSAVPPPVSYHRHTLHRRLIYSREDGKEMNANKEKGL